MFPKLTSSERDTIHYSFLSANAKQLQDATLLASLLCDDEENKDDAFLSLSFFYSRPENIKELRTAMTLLNMAE